MGQEAAVRSASAIAADSNRGRPRDRDRTRRAIVEAALRLAETKGKANLSLSGIAAEAGFATGTVYGYFRTKQDLIQSAFGEEMPSAALKVESAQVVSTITRIPATEMLGNQLPRLADTTHKPSPPEMKHVDAPDQYWSPAHKVDVELIMAAMPAKTKQSTETQVEQRGIAAFKKPDSIPASVEAENMPTQKSQRPDKRASDTVVSPVSARTMLRRLNDPAMASDTGSGIPEKHRTTLATPDKERSHLDAIIDRLVVPPASPSSGPAIVSRFERRIDVFESELAKIISQQASLVQRSAELEASANGSTAILTAKLDSGEQRRLQAVAELRGEILELSLRVKALENEHCAGSNPGLSKAPSEVLSTDTEVLPTTEIPDDEVELRVSEGRGSNLQAYLSVARQSANNAAVATAASGNEESRNDIKRYLLLGGVAIVALAAAVAAVGHKQPSRMEGATIARHAAHFTKNRVLRKTTAVIPPPAVLIDNPTPSENPAESALPESTVNTNRNAKQDAEQKPLKSANGQKTNEHSTGSKKALTNDGAPLDKISALAQAGDAKAQLLIGLKYLTDGASSENRARAKHWLELAAAKGLPVAQYRLGTVYQHGLAGPENPTKAMHWYEAAASHGNVKAMYNLAFGHAEGWGGPKNYAEAARWYSAAARLGYVDAQFNLAILYERGEGVPQSLLDAYKWYSIAAQNGDSGAAKRVEMIAPQLSASELSAGREAIVSFHPQQEHKAANVVPLLSDILFKNG